MSTVLLIALMCLAFSAPSTIVFALFVKFCKPLRPILFASVIGDIFALVIIIPILIAQM